jgi:hypothetical protein
VVVDSTSMVVCWDVYVQWPSTSSSCHSILRDKKNERFRISLVGELFGWLTDGNTTLTIFQVGFAIQYFARWAKFILAMMMHDADAVDDAVHSTDPLQYLISLHPCLQLSLIHTHTHTY